LGWGGRGWVPRSRTKTKCPCLDGWSESYPKSFPSEPTGSGKYATQNIKNEGNNAKMTKDDMAIHQKQPETIGSKGL
jgi:hypothetical protein